MQGLGVRQCVVLFGGAPGDERAGPLQACEGRPVLAWLIRELLRFGLREFLLLGCDPSGPLQDAAGAVTRGLPIAARIRLSAAQDGLGTGGALQSVRGALDERFLLCRGETLFDTNLARLFKARADATEAVLGHVLLGRGQGVGAAADPLASGIALLDRRLVAELGRERSLEDAMARLIQAGRIRSVPASGTFCDTAHPGARDCARALIAGRLRRPALFLDRDGVINVDHGYVGSRERFEWVPGAREAIRAATEAGFHVFVVTNQSGVARGVFDEQAVQSLHAWMVAAIRLSGGTIDDLRYCPYHEAAVLAAYRRMSDWRKPAPGMITDLMRTWQIDPARAVLIGDQPRDLAAAKAAGIAARLYRGGDLRGFLEPLLAR